MNNRRLVPALALLLCLCACSHSGHGSAAHTPAPTPTVFTETFASVASDVDKRLTTATSGASPGTACATLRDSALDGWIDRLSAAPDDLAGPIDRFLVRVQLALDKCQDNTSASTDLPAVVASADAVTQALATPAGPSPSVAASPAITTSDYVIPASPCTLALAAATPAPAAPPYGYSVDQVVNNAASSGDEPDGYRGADQAIRLMTPCNADQAAYQSAALDYLGWLAAAAACRAAFYDKASTIEDVGLWLDCITPVNAGIEQAQEAEQQAYPAAQAASCDPGYQPSEPPISAGLYISSLTSVTKTAMDAYEAVVAPGELGEVANDGMKLLFSRRVNAQTAGDYAIHVGIMIREPVTTEIIDKTREKLRELKIEKTSQTIPPGPAKVSIMVTGSGPGMAPTTINGAVTVGGN